MWSPFRRKRKLLACHHHQKAAGGAVLWLSARIMGMKNEQVVCGAGFSYRSVFDVLLDNLHKSRMVNAIRHFFPIRPLIHKRTLCVSILTPHSRCTCIALSTSASTKASAWTIWSSFSALERRKSITKVANRKMCFALYSSTTQNTLFWCSRYQWIYQIMKINPQTHTIVSGANKIWSLN